MTTLADEIEHIQRELARAYQVPVNYLFGAREVDANTERERRLFYFRVRQLQALTFDQSKQDFYRCLVRFNNEQHRRPK